MFTLARYKFAAKMLEGYEEVLEIGCGDGWASRIVQQSVKKLTLSDFDSVFFENAKERENDDRPLSYLIHDMVEKSTERKFNAIYAIDVLEHISPHKEDLFLSNLVESLFENGVAIMGIPSLESQKFASPPSKAGHVNCKTGQDFKCFMAQYFENVFLFSMNDEVVHTGFSKMAHYLLCVCCGVK